MTSKNKITLEEDELELLDSVEAGEWKSVRNSVAEISKAQEAAGNYFKKNARVNIRLPERDLLLLKQIAANEGMPYQTLISSVLHKFAASQFRKAA